MKKLIIFLVLFLFTSELFSQDTDFKVKRVIDGDTIELENGSKVRLIGVNTPETTHPSKGVEYYGKEASNFTRRMVEGKQIQIMFDIQRVDRYGRLLAYVFLDDSTFLNAELLKQGYAKISTYPPNIKYVEKFKQLEQEARENARGLWAIIPAQAQAQAITVYVTKTGTKYHRANCRYLKKSSILISLEEAKRRYSPCTVCNPPN